MNKKKIINDPVYGFVSIPFSIVFDILEHKYFQRLRRIKQLSLTHYVYPGALHTRFQHAIGALHLMCQAIEVLRSKGTEISEEEAKAVSIAILLHDIGHGPFSHTLENILVKLPHESLSTLFMEVLNKQFDNELDLAIRIFKNNYQKKFLHQLISGQLDMDRMDYLNRDSFFTGVYEGVIGYDRIIKMLAVHDGELVVEEKGIYSIEKFLIARRLMYWQVYLHKTVLAAEQMMVRILRRAKELVKAGVKVPASESLDFFLRNNVSKKDWLERPDELVEKFSELDDVDIASAIKSWQNHNDKILSFLSESLVHRRLFKLEFKNSPFDSDYVKNIRHKIANLNRFPENAAEYLLIEGKEINTTYDTFKDEIKILYKNGKVLPMSQSTDYEIHSKNISKHYLCFPKLIR